MADALDLEIAATMPWTMATGGSLWIGSGTYRGGTFTDCLLRCLPEFTHGTATVVFELLLYCDSKTISAAEITRAREVLLVYADDPTRAVEEADQDTVDRAVRLAAVDRG